jgi:DNA-binding LacI/PurR family transcriptional regulator
MPSINDVAERAGVSTATVSRAFRSPSSITEETQERVMHAARQLNYSPRRARVVAPATAASETGHTLSSIGFQFFADRDTDTLQSNAFYSSLLMGAQEEAASLGLNLLIHTTDRHRLVKEMPKMVSDGLIQGMLLVGAGSDAETLTRFAEHVPHLVLLDDRDTTGRFECVTSNGFSGAFEATRYLIGLGHQRIGFFLAEGEVRPFQDRLHGYISALYDANILPNPAWTVGGRFEDSAELRESRLRALFTGPDAPTALLVVNDEYAFFALRALRQFGLSVPGDVSLIGFDDTPFSTYMEPQLTTIRVDKEGMGRLAVRRLYSRMQTQGQALPPVHNELPVTLVVRESCRSL